jgi:UDP-N-acetylglucosamine 2-epimerase (non-hydrolysing)
LTYHRQVAPLVCFVVGARPNFMKAAPVLRGLEALDPELELLLVHTGQHYDPEMSDVFINELGLPEPDVFLGVGSGSHAEQMARALSGVARVLEERRPNLVVVSGDVNSTLAAALAASSLGIPVAHVESGLRSFDPAMPEERNRRLTDHLSAVLLAHSASALENLATEGIDAGTVHLVGNTMIDSLLEMAPRAQQARPWERHGLAAREYGLVTLHRPALVDDPPLLAETMRALADLAREIRLIFPVHPRTRARIDAHQLDGSTAGLQLTEPLGYVEFVGLEAGASFVITDSGGIQEETSALGVPCFTLRDSTERPVTLELGTNRLLGLDPASIAEIPAYVATPPVALEIPLWDGHAGERAAAVLAGFVRGTEAFAEAAG